jgi:hypothetical protein
MDLPPTKPREGISGVTEQTRVYVTDYVFRNHPNQPRINPRKDSTTQVLVFSTHPTSLENILFRGLFSKPFKCTFDQVNRTIVTKSKTLPGVYQVSVEISIP